jgi:predicted TIM-barrel fold metal-dependent hydrolase
MLVDAHTHVTFSASEITDELRAGRTIRTTNIDEFLRIQGEAGIDRTVIYGQDMSRIWSSTHLGTFKPIGELVSRYPGRIAGLGSVTPIDQKGRLNRTGLRQFRQAVKEFGLRGLMLGAGYGHWYPNDRRLYPFYEAAEELDAVIAFHLGTVLPHPAGATVCPLKYGRPWLLDDVLIDFPSLRINVEHMGYPWPQETLSMMVHAPNLYTDIALITRQPTMLAWNLVAAKEMGVIDRVMWGSDRITWGAGGEGNTEVVLKELDLVRRGLNVIAERAGWPTLAPQEVEGILGANAVRFYGLS